MPTSDPSGEIYSHESNPAFEAQLAVRKAKREAAFLLPHLRPGMRLLDVGCGPGSITLGLAQAVFPGQVVGIDRQPAQIDSARALAVSRGIHNVRFEVATVYELPFASDSFDVAFANGVIMHLREPLRALCEMRRILRPGGIAAVRDPDWGTSVHAPMTPRLQQWIELAARVREFNGGNPYLARHYRQLLLDAGFVRTEASGTVNVAGSLDETRRHGAFLQAQRLGLAPTALGRGWLERAELEALSTEIDAWAVRPDAFAATTWCEALGWLTGQAWQQPFP